MAVVGVSHFFLESYSIHSIHIYTANRKLHLFLARRMVCQGNSHPLPNPLADAADRDPGNRETLTFDEGCSNPFLDMYDTLR